MPLGAPATRQAPHMQARVAWCLRGLVPRLLIRRLQLLPLRLVDRAASMAAAGIRMLRLGGLELGFLFSSGGGLVLRFPVAIGHAVDMFAGAVIVDVHAAQAGFRAVPFGQAVAAETGQIHQVDILYISALLQV